MLIGLTCRHLLDNNPAPEWLAHTRSGTRLRRPDTVVPGTGYTQGECIRVAQHLGRIWVAGRRVSPTSIRDYVNKFSGAKRNRLVDGINWTEEQCKLDFRVTGFVKCDKYDDTTANTKAPRMIQFRKPGTNAELAKFMEPVEHELLMGPGLGPTGTPECAKGYTVPQTAQIWHRKRTAFPDPACWLLDFSKFDCHVHTHTLRLEHEVWRAMTGLELKMLDQQLINTCTAGPFRYKAAGTRMSGDRNTGGGNSIINVLVTRTVAAVAGVEVEFLCDGDDSLLWLPRCDADRFMEVARSVIPKVFGMRLEGLLVTEFHQEEFCHMTLAYNIYEEPMVVIDPIRAIERALWTVNQSGRWQCGAILVGNLVSLFVMYPNAPVISRVTWNLLVRFGVLSADGGVSARHSFGENTYIAEICEQHARPFMKRGRLTLPSSFLSISEDARAQLNLRFGICPELQVFYE